MKEVYSPMASREGRVDAAIAEFLIAQQEGQPFDREQWLAKHADLAKELGDFLTDVKHVAGILEPLKGAPDETVTYAPDRGKFDLKTGIGSKLSFPATVGDYEVLGEIARGGMGVVYRARQVVLDRHVALKMIRAGEFADEDEVRRFRQEAEAAAALDHPNIVSIFEVGDHNGVQFFAMRLVEGGSLANRMADFTVPKALNRADGKHRQAVAAQLIADVARAVHHAHQRGILHRDLKPGNILIDSAGAPHVTDFGLARRIGKDSTLTRTGAILGTPSYMAPEQARGRDDVTTEADVYGMGAVLYELLAGRPPFVGEDVLDTLYQVREREPASPRTHCPQIDRDLETICLKCLEKNPAKRYSSAAALADDLDRWRNNEPILARRAGPIERAVKWVRRNPAGAGLVGLGTIAAAAIIWGLVALSYNDELLDGKRKLEAANGKLDDANKDLQSANDQLDDANKGLQSANKQLDTASKMAREAEALARRSLYVTQMNQAQKAHEEKKFGYALSLLDKLRPERSDQEDLRGPEWHHLWRMCGGSHIDLRGHKAGVLCAAYSPDGFMLASADADGTIILWDMETQRERRTMSGSASAVNCLAFDPSGKRLAAGGDDRIVRFWDVDTGREISKFTGHTDIVLSVAFHPTADRIASGGRDGNVSLWDATSGKLLHSLLKFGSPIRSVAITPDGKTIVAAPDDASVRTWDCETGAEGAQWKPATKFERVINIFLKPDGMAVLIGRGNSVRPAKDWLELRTLPGNLEIWQLPMDTESVRAVSFNADGKNVAVLTSGGNIYLHALADGKVTKSFQAERTNAVCLAPTGRSLVTCGEDRVVRIRILRDEIALPGGRNNVAFNSDGTLVVAMGANAVWNPLTGQRMEIPDFGHHNNRRIAISPNGRFISDGTNFFDRFGGEKMQSKTVLPQGTNGGAFSPDSRLFVSTTQGGRFVGVYETNPLQLRYRLEKPRKSDVGHPTPIQGSWTICARFSPDGRTLAVGFGTLDNAGPAEVQLWDVESQKIRTVIDRHSFSVWELAFSPDGKFLACASGLYQSRITGEVKIWDAFSGREVATFGGYSACVFGVSFSPDGKRLATASSDNVRKSMRVRIWDLPSSQEVVSIAYEKAVYGVAYSPDGRRLGVVGEGGGTIWGPP